MTSNSSPSFQPSFFIVGAAKAGTTTLYNWLASHPDVYMSPVKEPNFFAKDIDTSKLRPQVKKRLDAQDLDGFISKGMNGTLHRAYITDANQYNDLFSGMKPGMIAGEASASYLWSHVAASEIKKYNPSAKIIVVLRDPATRAWSHYLMDRKLGFTEQSFTDALKNDQQLKVRSWGAASLYVDLGMYGEQLKRYYDVFPASQLLILRNEDLKHDAQGSFDKICSFLNIRNSKVSTASDANVAAVPKNRIAETILSFDTVRVRVRRMIKGTALHSTLRKLIFTAPSKSQEDQQTINELRKLFSDDITQLEQLTHQDFSSWK